MKMAVARKKEIESAQILAGILDDIDSGTFPRWVNGEYLDDDPEHFDPEDYDHLRALYDRLMKVELLWRVSLGYAVLTDPLNQVIDPDLGYLELHPRLLDGLRAVHNPVLFWAKRLWSHIEAVKMAWNEEKAAQM